MGLGDVTQVSVERAIAEHERLGAEAFRSTYGFGPAKRFVLVHDGRTYDSTAIVGVAHGFATDTFWRAKDFSGGAASVVRTLQRLGFDARDLSRLPQPSERARYGEIAGYPEGSTFANRAALHRSGVHRPTQAGICGTGAFGAESIVVSGGYIDDQDLGNLIIYTGHGGQDKNKRQVADQTFEDSGNAGLLTSSISGALVRVIRGAHKGSSYAPESGLRYDGLYRVVDAWREAGQHGFQVCRYKLTKADSGPGARKRSDLAVPDGEVTPGRRDETVQRIVRSTKVSRFIKSLYDDTCQACRTRLVVAGDRSYSEGAHIRPLGRGHDGPDIPSNVLCLCPNCHVLFDNGAMIIDAERQVWVNGTLLGPLTVDDQHYVDEAHLAYHRDHYGAAGSGA